MPSINDHSLQILTSKALLSIHTDFLHRDDRIRSSKHEQHFPCAHPVIATIRNSPTDSPP